MACHLVTTYIYGRGINRLARRNLTAASRRRRVSLSSGHINMATVARFSRPVSTLSRHFRGVTRSYGSWRNDSKVTKWRRSVGALATTSIAILAGYSYSKMDVVHALKSRKVRKSQIPVYLRLSRSLSLQLRCTINVRFFNEDKLSAVNLDSTIVV